MIKPNGSDPIAKLVGLGVVSSLVLLWASTAQAQRRPIADETLGTERTIVTPVRSIRGRPGDRIESGARRGNNLFHSFQDFQVDATRGVYFIDPGVDNIVGRVTGGIQSDILGTLGVLGGDANLFLINPSGILFGPGARLDVGGSFVATTANAIGFGNQGFFGVADPNAPALLTVQPSAFLFNQINPGTIENQSRASLGDDGLGNEVLGLQVPNGQNLVFLGGTVVNRGNLNAFRGRVELGSVAGLGTVGLGTDGSLSFPSQLARADVRIIDGSRIDVTSGNRGDIAINARNIDISGRSSLQAGIFSGLGTVDSQAGDIVLNATDAITVEQTSLIANNVFENAIGNAGDLRIAADTLSVSDGSQLQASTLGQGNAGNVIIDVQDTAFFNDGVVFSTVGFIDSNTPVVGNGGDIRITAGSLSLSSDSQLATSIVGRGDAGDIVINVQNTVSFNNSSALSAFANLNSPTGVGNGGDIYITAGSLALSNGANLQASTPRQGNAGNIVLNARNQISFDDTDAFSIVGIGTIGNGGDIRITTGSLSLSNGSQLQTLTSGRGDAGSVVINAQDEVSFNNADVLSTVEPGATGTAGNIRISTGSLLLSNQSSLQVGTAGRGDAGEIIVNAQNTVSFNNSTAISIVEPSVIGTGDDIRITTGSLLLSNGALLGASTLGQGDAGNVIINAQDRVTIEASNITSSVGVGGINVVAVGNGGDIRINTGSLFLRNGSQLQAGTLGWGDAGDVIINARDTVSFAGQNNGAGSGVLSSVGLITLEGIIPGIGDGGDIRINTGSLEVSGGAGLSASTYGRGNAGDVMIHAQNISFRGVGSNGLPSAAYSTVGAAASDTGAVGNGGDIRIRTDSLEVTDGAQLATGTVGRGDAGDVIIYAQDRVSFDGVGDNQLPSSALSSVGPSNLDVEIVGNGGDIRIRADSLEVTDGAQLSASTLERGNAGDVIIHARDTVFIEGVGIGGLSSGLFTLTYTEANGLGGDITIRADSIRLTDGAVINAQTFNAFRGGNITLNADTFTATGGGQVITTALDEGNAGNITLNAGRITLSSFDPTYADRRSQFGSRVSNQGAASGLFANTARRSSGQGGTIQITAGELEISDRARIVVNSEGSGVAGNMNITAQSIQLNRGRLTAETGTGDGGNITLDDIDFLQLQNGSVISTTAGTRRAGGNGGNLAIDSNFIVASPTENSDITANAFMGSGGNVTITTQGLFGIEPQASPTDRSDITASSEEGVQGTIDINTPDVDPSRGITELPAAPVDASNQIAQTCPTNGNIAEALGEFVVTGRGGLPANPTELLSGDAVLPRLSGLPNERTEARTRQGANPEVNQPDAVNPPLSPIVEAQGWQIDTEGNVALIAAAPSRSSAFAEVQCHSSD
ncbi:filamentous hemagglutinin N-terminal domain-containing protein [Phormidium tenue FACHB-886]|nr:filamentous hemagglutinin N-terminal domain-containing protein [Phormidium tenue FACHB-886]